MQFTIKQDGVEDRVYQAFQSYNQHHFPGTIAIALFDGDSDIYEVAPGLKELAKSEIVRMYQDEYGRGPSNLVLYMKFDQMSGAEIILKGG